MIFVIVLLILLIAAIIVAQNLKIRVFVDFSENSVSADAYCLYPFLKMRIELENNLPYLNIYLFKIRCYKRALKRNIDTHEKANFLKSVNIRNLIINTYYGFSDPFSTGIFSGILGIANALPVPADVNQYPNFFASSNYLRIEALGYLKLGDTIKNYVRYRSKIKKESRIWRI